MARPKEYGIDYFSLNVDFFDDPKLLFVSNRFEEKGELIVIKLLSWIYKNNGYYTEWNDELAMLFAKRAFVNIKYSLVNDVVEELIKRDFFSRKMFDSFRILTSSGIQKMWSEATKRRIVKINPEYDLIGFCNSNETETPKKYTETNPRDTETFENRTIIPQSKVKETKVKESKVDNNPLPQMGESESLKTDLKKIVDHYNQVCKRMPRVTTLSDARKKAIKNRVKQYGESKVLEMFDLAAASEFLNGNNGHEWTANLDWLLKPSNFVKVIDGNYKNIRSNGKHKASDPRASVSGYQEKL